MTLRILSITSVFFVCALAALTTVNAADPIRFNGQIRPLLSDRCFACHGPDAKRREAELRLDQRQDAIGEGQGPAAIVPGKPLLSPLWVRITSSDPDLQMPPASVKKPPLTEAELSLIRRWIEEGAEYEGHWAFLPVKAVTPPPVAQPSANPIDAFVRARQIVAGINPSPPADLPTLLRRAMLDLTGIIPTPEELRDYENDVDPAAYERVIDRLLASPQFGERWGRHWLDQARYADSNGYAIDAPRDMWPYRDWVIDALNRDLPFDQFTVQQIAGDLLPDASKANLIASAFHRNTLINQEGGSDREQFRVEAVMDRVNTTGAVWLGLTVGCAQCHTHKFDPITQREYYQLMAFFNSAQDANDRGPTVDVRRDEVFGNPVAIPEEPKPLSKEEIAQRRSKWEQATRQRLEAASGPMGEATSWLPLKYQTYVTRSGSGTLKLIADNSLLYDMQGTANEQYRIAATTDTKQLAAIRLRVLTDDSLPKRGPGTAGNGNFVLSEFTARVGDDRLAFSRVVADHEQPNYAIAGTIDNRADTGWAINIGNSTTAVMNANHEAVFVLAKPLELEGRGISIELSHDANKNYHIGRFAIDVAATFTESLGPDESKLLLLLQKPVEQRSRGDAEVLQAAFEKAEPRANPPKKEPDPNVVPLMVMRELPQPRDTYLFTRGDFTRPDKDAGKLGPDVLSAVAPKLPDGKPPRSRLDLANWLVDRSNPLTARVAVNRVWMHYFGRGLVETEEDFGTQGTPPTHPELLDWLSAEFQRDWSTKRLHRLIVTSDTYRQSSRERPDLVDRDPRNLLLARQQRLRLEAEIVRDAALSASGLLNSSLGGPSVFPPQPDGVYTFTQVNKTWPTETGPQRYRRTMYTFFYRSAPYPLFTTFDTPDLQTTCTRRLRSNTPLQALTLSNDTVFLEPAQALALRLAETTAAASRTDSFAGQLDARIEQGVVLCFGRKPTDAEKRVLRDLVVHLVEDFAGDLVAAEKLTTPALRRKLPPDQAAALVVLVRTLFNADVFITRE
jgi:hypothetical protein